MPNKLFSSDYQLIYPIISEEPHISTVYSSQRHRRSAPQLRNDLFLNFTAFNQTFQLHLRRNGHFVAPHSFVQYRYYNVSSSTESIEKQCYFKGKVASRRGKAAVSLCDGVVSSFHQLYQICIPMPHLHMTHLHTPHLHKQAYLPGVKILFICMNVMIMV